MDIYLTGESEKYSILLEKHYLRIAKAGEVNEKLLLLVKHEGNAYLYCRYTVLVNICLRKCIDKLAIISKAEYVRLYTTIPR